MYNMTCMGPNNLGGYDGLQHVVENCVALGQHPLVSTVNVRLISRAICNLTNIIGQRPRLVTEGVVGSSVVLLKYNLPEVTRNVVVSLLNLSKSKGELRSTMIRQGVVDTLLGLVMEKSGSGKVLDNTASLSAKEKKLHEQWDKEIKVKNSLEAAVKDRNMNKLIKPNPDMG